MTQPFDQEKDALNDSFVGEFYFANGETVFDEETDELVWKDILREGEWQYRPGAKGPVNIPLRVLAGHAEQKGDVGMQDLVDAFDEGVVDHVTVPTNHDDKPHENTGYVRKLKIVEREGKKFLRAGIEFTEPDIKERAIRGSIPNTSAGIMFDYIKKESGKIFNQILGHVALTGKPWINGMAPFSEDEAGVDIIVAQESPEWDLYDDEFIDHLDLDAKLVPNKPGVANWVEKHGGLPKKIADMAGDLITERGMTTSHAIATAVSRAKLLCAKGNKDWCAAVAEWEKLRAAAHASMGEDLETFGHEANNPKEDLSEDGAITGADDEENTQTKEELNMGEVKEKDNTGDVPSTDVGDSAPVELSEEQRKELFAEFAEKQAEKDAELASKNAELESKVHAMEVEKRISELSTEGYAEYPGLLAEIRGIMLADSGDTMTLSLSEEVDGKTETSEVEVTVTGAIERVLSALPKTEGKPNLGDQLNAAEDHSKPDADAELSEDEKLEGALEFLGIEKATPKKDGDE